MDYHYLFSIWLLRLRQQKRPEIINIFDFGVLPLLQTEEHHRRKS